MIVQICCLSAFSNGENTMVGGEGEYISKPMYLDKFNRSVSGESLTGRSRHIFIPHSLSQDGHTVQAMPRMVLKGPQEVCKHHWNIHNSQSVSLSTTNRGQLK